MIEHVVARSILRTAATKARAGSDTSTPETLFGLSFESVSRAQQFMLAVKGLAHDHKLRLADAVMVVKDSDHTVHVRETVDLQAGRTAISAAMWTGLLGLIIAGPVGWVAGIGIGAGIGAIAAELVDLGIPDEWVAWFEDAVMPGTATVLVLASRHRSTRLGRRGRSVPRSAARSHHDPRPRHSPNCGRRSTTAPRSAGRA